MNQTPIKWNTFGLIACSLMLAAGVQAQNGQPGVALLATDPTALVGSSGGAFTLVRYGDTNGTLTVTVDISGTGVNGVDYEPITNVITLNPGDLAADIVVSPLLDTANRGNKTVELSVEPNAAYRIHGRGTAKVKIVDDLYDVPPPTVTMSSPGDGTVFTAPATITLTADVSDPDLPIAGVSFYANDKFLGRATTSPYTIVWNNVSAGHYAIFSRAEDEFGKSAVSSAVHVTVSATPVVTLDLPNGTNYESGMLVEMDALIGDSNEDIQSVAFSVNGKVVDTVTSAPFTFTYTASKPGTYNLQAVAIDAKTGKKGNSAKIPITVTPFLGGN